MRRQSDAQRAALDVGDSTRPALALFQTGASSRSSKSGPTRSRPSSSWSSWGFELGRPVRRSTSHTRVMAEVCDAVHHAHGLGLTHRDLKPANVMLDSQLVPRILDFGLSGGDPQSGHLKGTLPYIAPEQLDPAHPIDERTDVYGLGAILYELLCGAPPHSGLEDAAMLAAIRQGHPRLPIEIDPRVPEPLQAIALAAMEVDPLDATGQRRTWRRTSAVFSTADPSAHGRLRLDAVDAHAAADIQEWLRLRLIYPHEAEQLRASYAALDAREDDWILASRALSYTQIALYLGAFLVLFGSLFYFVAARWHEAVDGIMRPFAVLGLPFIGLNVAAHWLYARDHKAVAVAFYLGAVALLPLFLLIAFHETGFLVVPDGTDGQLFQNGSVSNRQLQITIAAAALWCGWLSLRTRTMALSTVFNVLALLLTLAVISDFGLREWLENGHWDRLALHLFPLVAAYAAIGAVAERTGRVWLSRPAYTGSAVMLVAVLELLALNGKAFAHLGLSLTALQPARVSDPMLLDTVAAMTLNGALFYVVAAALDRRRADPTRVAAWFLFTIAPFAMLQPLGWLVKTAEYSLRIDWLYAASAGIVMLLSHQRQRRSFYYAGLLNLANALFLIADHRDWFNRPAWAVVLIAAGLAVLGAGLMLDRRERRR
jgi:hypothetical protein